MIFCEKTAWASQIQRARAYTRYATALDPVSEPTTVHVRSKSLTDWASSRKGAPRDQENPDWPGGHQEAEGRRMVWRAVSRRVTPYAQEVLGSREDAE